jgi:arylsulfatase A-like enzyme
MKAAGLLLVFVAAKLAVIPGTGVGTGVGPDFQWSAWAAVAYFWQDVVVALLFGGADIVLRKAGVSARIRWSLYWTIVGYAVLNIPVERALFTPLTWPMLRAARGPLADSLLHDATPVNVLLMALTLVIGSVPVLLTPEREGRRSNVRLLIASVPLGLVFCFLLGPTADARVDTRGMNRNVISALLTRTRLPKTSEVASDVRSGDWRRSRFERETNGDLSSLRGIAKGRNIIMVSLESTAAQYLGIYGAAQDPTPNLSALAQDAVIFDHAYAAYPESIKGLFSVLCSTFPAFDTTAEQYAHVPCDSVAASLRAAGYRTGLFHSGRFSYLGMESVIQHRGFDTLEDAGTIGGHRDSSFGVDEPSTVDRMLSWIDASPRTQPFFLTYLPIAGHHPYEAPPGGPFPSTDDLGRYRNALHDGDVSLGRLVEGLRTRGLAQNTVWIVFGDHGEAFGQHAGNYGHTFFLYEENVHVPFAIAAPGHLRSRTHITNVVSLVDTAPTILDLAGIDRPEGDQGGSMLDPSPRMALFFADYSVGLMGLRDGPWKFICEVGSSRSTLFDLTHDPLERSDRSADQPERARWYREHLEGWAAAQKERLTRVESEAKE